MKNSEKLYLAFPTYGNNYISVDRQFDINKVPYCHNGAVPEHAHDYYELCLIADGMCTHYYRGTSILLMSGDVFLIPPHKSHYCIFPHKFNLYNLQFYPNISERKYITQILNEINFIHLSYMVSESNFSESPFSDSNDEVENPASSRINSLNHQGILHLTPQETLYIQSILNNMIIEQEERNYGYSYMQSNYLEMILINLKRIQEKQFTANNLLSSRKKEMVMNTIEFINKNLNSKIDFMEISEQQQLSPNYFRTIFKEVTGTSPINHLNRIRIIKALELLRTTDLPVIEIAANVGIYDANYFTRLFKKYLGYPPRYFKNIPD